MDNNKQSGTVIKSSDVRQLKARWVFRGQLVLETPAALGSGKGDGLIDNPVIRDSDPLSGKFILTGESLAGAMRSFLVDLEHGYLAPELEFDKNDKNKFDEASLVRALFGSAANLPISEDSNHLGIQSPLIVYDALSISQKVNQPELRDGISRDPKSDIVKDKFKFDFEVVPRETCFQLRFDLLIHKASSQEKEDICDQAKEEQQLCSLLHVLQGLEKGAIHIGAYKFKGLGECRVKDWQVQRFDLSNRQGWEEWLESDPNQPIKKGLPIKNGLISSVAAYTAKIPNWSKDFTFNNFIDKRDCALFTINLQQVGGYLHAGSAGVAEANYLRSGDKPVLSGRGLHGALRARAQKIANTLGARGELWAEKLFGSAPKIPNQEEEEPEVLKATRVHISEAVLKDVDVLLNTRVAIDRFTGGALDEALFDETLVYNGTTTIKIRLINPEECEVGLLLLVIGDLIREDLPLGGTVGIGRGRFKGDVDLLYKDKTYHFCSCKAKDNDTATYLQRLVTSFLNNKHKLVKEEKVPEKDQEVEETEKSCSTAVAA